MWRRIAFLLTVLFCPTIAANTPTCAPGFTLSNNKCLKLFTDPVNRITAERTCKDHGATLTTVKNFADNLAVTTLTGKSASLVWIGLYCFDNAKSKCLWDDASGSAENYDNFAHGFPLVDVGNCVYYSTQGSLSGQWLNGDCANSYKSFICELPTTFEDSCQYNYNGNCFTFHISPLPFASAQGVCEQECGNLASIHSAKDNFYLAGLISRGEKPNQLIGVTYSSPDIFGWTDNSEWNYSNLAALPSNNSNCLVISNGTTGVWGEWLSVKCGMANSFICKRSAGTQCNGTPAPVTVTPAPSNPSFCNAPMLTAPGIISSPNYPSNYDNNVLCTYELSTLGSYNIILRFSSFDTELNHDYVKVFDGDSATKKLLGSYSGSVEPFSLVSSGNMMVVTFSADASNAAQGFQASFTSYSYGR